MPSQEEEQQQQQEDEEEELTSLRARFEAARSFEDDDDWILTNSPSKPTRRPTLTLTKLKSNPPPIIIHPALKKWAVQAAKQHPLSLTHHPGMKFEPGASYWEGSAPGERSWYAVGGEGNVEGWRVDECGRAVRVEESDGRDKRVERERLLARIVERSERRILLGERGGRGS